MSLTPLQSDSFNSADGPLFNRFPDNALGGSDTGGWLDQVGSHGSEIVSNRAVNTDTPTGGIHVAITQAAPSTDCRVTGVCYGQNIGVIARYDTVTGKFYVYGGTSGGSTEYYYDGAAFNTIMGGGPGLADGDSIALVPEGTNLTCYKNGSVAIPTQTDTHIASGKYGFYSEGGGAGFDSILCETGTVGSTPTKLGITTAPVGNQSGVALTTQPVIAVQDVSSATVTSDTSTVVASITVLTGSVTLGGTTSKAAVAGVATFTNLAPTGTGSYTLTFSDGALTSVTTGTLYVGATQLAITSAPTTAFSKHASTIVVTAKDANGVAVGNYTGTVAVTLTKTSGAGSVATLTGGTSSAAAVAGVATLTPIATTTDNGLVATSYTYTAAASGLTSATTATITPTISESIAVTIT